MQGGSLWHRQLSPHTRGAVLGTALLQGDARGVSPGARDSDGTAWAGCLPWRFGSCPAPAVGSV